MAEANGQTRQLQGVQALRFIAAFLVVVGHATYYTQERLDPDVPVWTFTTVGVDIFFVISGFVMIVSSRSLVGRRDGWKVFVSRRAVRIIPMYWIATTIKLGTMILLPGAVLHVSLNWVNAGLSYLFIPSRNLDGNVQPLLGVGWTLVFEVFFYAVFAIALALRVRPLLFCGIILTVLAVGHLLRPQNDWHSLLVYFDPIVLYFLVGMVIGQFVLDRATRAFIARLMGIIALLAVIWLVKPPIGGLFDHGHLIREVAVIAVLVFGVLLEPRLQSWVPRWMLFMGDASYTLYLFHPLLAPIVPVLLNRVGVFNGWLSVFLCIVVSVVGAIVVYTIIERPLTGLLQRSLPYIRPHATGVEQPVPAPGHQKAGAKDMPKPARNAPRPSGSTG